jgi:hypothetical protein
MKRHWNVLDPELQQKIEGLSTTQIRLMADILAGLANELSKTAARRRAERLEQSIARN